MNDVVKEGIIDQVSQVVVQKSCCSVLGQLSFLL